MGARCRFSAIIPTCRTLSRLRRLAAGLRSFAVAAREPEPTALADGVSLTTAAWSLSVDPATGGLRSLRDANGREWVDARGGGASAS